MKGWQNLLPPPSSRARANPILGGRGGFRSSPLEVIIVQLIQCLRQDHQSRRLPQLFIHHRMVHSIENIASGAAPGALLGGHVGRSSTCIRLDFLKTYLRASYVKGHKVLSRMGLSRQNQLMTMGYRTHTSEFMLFMINHIVNSC